MSKLNDVATTSVRGGFFLFLGMLTSTLIMALTTIIIARLLGPEDYGLYTVILTVPSFLITLSDLGISPALTRFSANLHTEGENGKIVNLIKTGILTKLAFTLTISLFLLLFSEQIATIILNRPGSGYLIQIASLYIIGQAILTSINSTLIGLDEAGKSSLLMNVQAVTKALVSPLLIILGLGVAGALMGIGIGFILAATTGAAVLLFLTRANLKRNRRQSKNINSSEGLRMMISYGAPLYISALIISFQAQIRNIFLAQYTSNVDIGNYATAMNFSILISILASPIATSLFPAFSKLNIEKHRDSVEKMFTLSVKYTSLIIIPASTAIAILSKHLVQTLYGAQYPTAPGYLTLYMLNFMLTGLLMNVFGALFNGQGDTKTTFKIYLVNLVITIPTALLLIPRFSVEGLIGSILVSHLISTIYGLSQVHRRYNMKIDLSSFLKTVAASLSSALPVHILLKLAPLTNPMYSLALGGALYITSLLVLTPILGAITMEDLENLEGLIEELPLIYPIAKFILSVEKKIIKKVNYLSA